MNCFNHIDVAACGICKHCQKAVCKSCLELVDGSVSCKGSCEKQVQVLNQIIEKSSQSLTTTESVYIRNAFFGVLMGLLFSGFGVFSYFRNGNTFSYFMMALGVIMIGSAISSYFSGKEYGKNKDT